MESEEDEAYEYISPGQHVGAVPLSPDPLAGTRGPTPGVPQRLQEDVPLQRPPSVPAQPPPTGRRTASGRLTETIECSEYEILAAPFSLSSAAALLAVPKTVPVSDGRGGSETGREDRDDVGDVKKTGSHFARAPAGRKQDRKTPLEINCGDRLDEGAYINAGSLEKAIYNRYRRSDSEGSPALGAAAPREAEVPEVIRLCFDPDACQDCQCVSSRASCLSCYRQVCHRCFDAHQGKGHELLVLLDEEVEDEPSLLPCLTHDPQPVMGYCTSCRQLLCYQCVPAHSSDNSYQGKAASKLGQKLRTRLGRKTGVRQGWCHEVITMERAAQEAKKELNDAHDSVQQCLHRLRRARDDVAKDQESLEEKVSAMKETIYRRVSEVKKILDVLAAEAMVMLEDCKETKDTILASDMAALDGTAAEASFLLKHLDRALKTDQDVLVVRVRNTVMPIFDKSARLQKDTQYLTSKPRSCIDLKQDSLSSLVRMARDCVGQPILTDASSDAT